MNTAANNGVRTMDEAFEKLLQADTHPENISEALRRNAPMDPGPTLVPCLLYTSPSPRDRQKSRMPSSA